MVPIILKLDARLVTGHLSWSAVDFDVGKKYYVFQFVVVFLFVTVIGAASSGTGGGSSSSSTFPIVDLLENIAGNTCPSYEEYVQSTRNMNAAQAQEFLDSNKGGVGQVLNTFGQSIPSQVRVATLVI